MGVTLPRTAGQPQRVPLADGQKASRRAILGNPGTGRDRTPVDPEEADMPAKDELPSTLKRSPKKAQRTWSKTHDSAVEEYGEGERAHRTAFAAVKHSFEKVGDHWEPKDHKGPSDSQAAKSGTSARKGRGTTAGGVDANATKSHLMDVAKRLDIRGRSKMSKDELVEAIQKANAKETRKSRS
jgi:cation transport regulator ChaB